MLSRSSMRLAAHLVTNSKKVLGACFNPALNTPIRLSIPMMSQSTPSFESSVQGVELASRVSVEHDAKISESVEVIATGMSRSFDYVRTTVVPFIDAVTNELTECIERERPKGFTVIQLDPSPMINIPMFIDLISKYKNPGRIPNVITNARQYDTGAELIEKMKTGAPDLDDELANCITRIGESAVLDIYNLFFRGQVPANINLPVPQAIRSMLRRDNGAYVFKLKDINDLDIAIVSYFMLDMFLTDPVEGSGLSLIDYETLIGRSMAAVAYEINRLIGTYQNMIETNTLILNHPASSGIHFKDEDGYVVVNGAVYRAWLTKGLTPEMVIGAGIEGKNRNAANILKGGAAYERLTDRMFREAVDHAQRNRLRYFNSNVMSVFQQRLNDLNDDSLPGDYDRIGAVRPIGGAPEIKAFFSTTYDHDAGNLNELIETLACKYIFTFTDAGTIIDLINTEMTLHEETISTKEAAYFAYLRYFAKWAVATFDVVAAE